MVEVSLGGEGKKDFMRYKKTVTKVLVASDSIVSIAAPRGIAEDSLKMILDKFKKTGFQGLCSQASSKLSMAESI